MGTHFFLDMLYIWLPTLFAVLSVVGSSLVSWRHSSPAHICLTLIVWVFAVWSLFTLYRMFGLEEYQVQVVVFMGRERLNLIPHLVTFIVVCIFAGQTFWLLRHKPEAAS